MIPRSANTFAAIEVGRAKGHARPVGGEWLLRLVDLGLLGIIVVAPYFFGGRHDLGRLVYVSFVAFTAAAWFARQVVQPAPCRAVAIYGISLAVIVIVGLQVVPLPSSWVSWLAPRNAALLPLWTGGNDLLGTWRTISVAPHETTKALAVLAAHCLLFIVVVERIHTIADIQRVLAWIGGAAFLMAGFGLAQYFTSNANFFWFYEVPYRSTYSCVCGSFTNRNHFANFLVLGVVPLAGWLSVWLRRPAGESRCRVTDSPHRFVWHSAALGGALSLVLFAILLSMSRGGALGLLVAVSLAGAIYARGRRIESRHLVIVIALVTIVIGLLSVYGYDQVTRRFSSLTQGSIEAVDGGAGRRQIWQANVTAIGEGGLLGSGAGTHVKIYPSYTADSQFGQFTHAECGYLQIATEAGLLGTGVFLVAIGLGGVWFWKCWRQQLNDTESLCFAAITSGLAASLVHSVVDFVWFIPACMSITLILAACLTRLTQLTSAETTASYSGVASRSKFLARAGLAIVVAGIGSWTIWTLFGPAIAAIHWDRYLRVSIANRDASRYELANLVENRQLTHKSDAHHLAMHEAMTRHLGRVIAWDPNFADARLKLARRQLDEFELRQRAASNAMDVGQVRDAAHASGFKTLAEQRAWLQRAFGESSELLHLALDNAREGIEQSPLSGDGYLILAKLCFLEGGDRSAVKSYLDQGLRVRPYDGELLYEVGLYEFNDGRHEFGLELWKRCFQTAGPHRLKVIYSTAGRIPAVMFIEVFQPDWQTLPSIWARYREFGNTDDLNTLVAYAARQANRELATGNGDRAARVWFSLATMYRDLQAHEEELACLRRSYACSAISFDTRLALGQALLKAGQFAEAEPHFRWCLARRPTNRDLSVALANIGERRRAERQTAHATGPSGTPAWSR